MVAIVGLELFDNAVRVLAIVSAFVTFGGGVKLVRRSSSAAFPWWWWLANAAIFWLLALGNRGTTQAALGIVASVILGAGIVQSVQDYRAGRIRWPKRPGLPQWAGEAKRTALDSMTFLVQVGPGEITRRDLEVRPTPSVSFGFPLRNYLVFPLYLLKVDGFAQLNDKPLQHPVQLEKSEAPLSTMAPYGDSVDVHVRQVLNAEEAAFLQSAIAGGPDRPQASLWFGNVSLSFAIMTDDGPTKAAVSLGYKIFRVGD